tara:strand:- start:289 stop:555 length:267 start_codon:yes stop_codon:yes gene_type:complete
MDIAHFTPVKRSRIIFKKSQEDSLCKKIMALLRSITPGNLNPLDNHNEDECDLGAIYINQTPKTKNRAIQCEFSNDENDPWGQYVHID